MRVQIALEIKEVIDGTPSNPAKTRDVEIVLALHDYDHGQEDKSPAHVFYIWGEHYIVADEELEAFHRALGIYLDKNGQKE